MRVILKPHKQLKDKKLFIHFTKGTIWNFQLSNGYVGMKSGDSLPNKILCISYSLDKEIKWGNEIHLPPYTAMLNNLETSSLVN